ncbi:MAG: hypothetical protein NZ992_07450 [Candidatus Korarchaeum sp.]|nr:hypothetical protein [Candidatus Korarchaeum sp.]MDW8035362.1 hypothetical protein [Candidatus Korarchaeum sp.]
MITLLESLIAIYLSYRISVPAKRIFDLAPDKFSERISMTKTTLERMIATNPLLSVRVYLYIYLPSVLKLALEDWAFKLVYLG